MKKILAMVLSLALVATLAISGTVAYLTDDESAVNVMTVGKVDVQLWEEQRENDGTTDKNMNGDLEKFEDGKNLMPITNDGTGTNKWGMSMETNYIDKIVRVKNVGESPAWVRIFIAVPAALEVDYDENDPAANVPLHWDTGVDFIPEEGRPIYGSGNDAYFTGPVKLDGTIEIDEIEYNVYTFTTNDPVAVEEFTAAAMVGMYLDPAVDYNDNDGKYYFGTKTEGNEIGYDLDEDVEIHVFVEAIQSEGFATAEAAFSANDNNLPANPWEMNKAELPESTIYPEVTPTPTPTPEPTLIPLVTPEVAPVIIKVGSADDLEDAL